MRARSNARLPALAQLGVPLGLEPIEAQRVPRLTPGSSSQSGAVAFEALQMRLHPVASRIKRLSEDTPAELMLFDCL